MKRVTLGNHRMIVLGTVQGLVKEKLKVKTTFDDLQPDIVALPISVEMLDGLRAVVEGEVLETATNSIDDLFADHLRRFGEVQLPPPSLVEAYRLAHENGIEVTTLDMNEEDYGEAYTDHVSGYHFWRRIWNMSRLEKRTFVADTPEEFVVSWDAYVTKLKGYADLERHREEYMAKKAVRLLRKHERVLILVEYERMEGVTAEIQKRAGEPDDGLDEEQDEVGSGKDNESGEDALGTDENKFEGAMEEDRSSNDHPADDTSMNGDHEN